ncbi:HAD hydrolase family protein [Patescibacteria group bacterium]|nr:HAD hydrolase family protein [Patescibacteria group bacterium]MBU4389920.1 HAD hydrolase family protein [Patescibacteria group bacterium]MBU4396873.1 HAD hydrolase family protein [Patescibacteria group bacterium]MBU4431376.1 HAD hydrolase family protein [Patescibacteria group bacterium]MCG2701884.1 HAD hydrolase family protein [Candidatus Parcubacteria bacterium]
MKGNLNKPIEKLTKSDIENIKLICFDCDGVTVEKGTEVIENKSESIIRTKEIRPEMVEKIVELGKYFHVSFSSGRSMLYLKRMYENVLRANVSLQAEIGMFCLHEGKLEQNFELSGYELEVIRNVRLELANLKDERIEGFEPKIFLTTLHCKEAVSEVDEIVKKNDSRNEFYCWWNEEAYDIGPKRINKGTGLEKLTGKLGIKMVEVMTVGNGINDENMTEITGIDVSTDPKNLKADFAVFGEHLAGEKVVDKLLQLRIKDNV